MVPRRIPFATLVLVLAPLVAAAEFPDRVYLNAAVWTGDVARPNAEAFAVRGDRIVAVGSGPEIRRKAGPATEVIDLGGRRVVPGFNDAHWHLPSRRSARLDNSGSIEVVQQRLSEYAGRLPAGAWVVGRGWMPTDFPDRVAHRRYLDAIFPDRPVVIRDRDGHQALANTRALQMAGITRDTADPPDGWIVRDEGGEPTGLLKEAADDLVLDLLPALSVDDTYAMLLDELTSAASFGITSLQDATDVGLTETEHAAVMRAVERGNMTVRYRAPLPLEKDVGAEQLRRHVDLRDATRDSLVSYGFVKTILDGTVDAKTAFMLEPYVGGGNGVPMLSQQELNAAVAAYDRVGLQVEIHAIGDGTIRMSLDAFEHAARVNGPRERRHRVEHVEVPAAADLPRFAQLGVIASTQPIGASPDVITLENYAPLLGPERSVRAYNPKQFDDAGAVQAFGSDYPVYTMNPLAGIHAVVTRTTPDGKPSGGWYPESRITVEAALRHYTRHAAYASFDEDRKGTIAPGQYADFAVLSRDILAIPPAGLLQTRVLLTVMGGRETFRSPEFGDSLDGPSRARTARAEPPGTD